MRATRDGAAERIRESIARLVRLRSEGRVPVRPPAGWAGAPGAPPPVSPSPPVRRDLLDLPGASLRRFASGDDVLTIRRPMAELLPGVDLAGELAAGLAALDARAASSRSAAASHAAAAPAAAAPDAPDPGLLPARGRTLADLVVLDLETTGFWGCPIFLVGLLLVDGGELVSLQLLARDYPEEAPMLRAAAELLASRRLLVTFNGKSYDVPCLRERCVVHRVDPPAPSADLAHVDILHPARRRWRATLPDCRLQTLERHVVGLWRTGDVPSAEIPGVYHAFTASGDPAPLLPVLHHGRVDVVTTARVFARLAGEAPPPPRP